MSKCQLWEVGFEHQFTRCVLLGPTDRLRVLITLRLTVNNIRAGVVRGVGVELVTHFDFCETSGASVKLDPGLD